MGPVSEQSAYVMNVFKADDLIIDRYQIIKTLGRGTSGMVYQAKDLQVGRDIALKLIFIDGPHQETTKQRLHQEIRIAFKIDSDYVIKLYDCFTWGCYVGLVLEYVDGTSLFDITQSKKTLTWREITSVGRQVALGLHAIHQAGIVHRDIKLENVLLNSNGIAKITDFGVSIRETMLEPQSQDESIQNHSPDMKANHRLTEDGRVVGTIHYLSPEYLKTQKCDSRGDIYALGILLYELVTNRYPFDYSNMPDLVRKKIEEEPLSLLEFREDCPNWLHDLIMRCMDKNPAKRPPSAESVYKALAGALSHQPQLNPNVRKKRLNKFHPELIKLRRQRKRVRIYRTVGTLLILLLLALSLFRWDLVVMIFYQVLTTLSITIDKLFYYL